MSTRSLSGGGGDGGVLKRRHSAEIARATTEERIDRVSDKEIGWAKVTTPLSGKHLSSAL